MYSIYLKFNCLFNFQSPFVHIIDDLLEADQVQSLEHAFRVAHEELAIDRLLDAEGKLTCFCHSVMIHFL